MFNCLQFYLVYRNVDVISKIFWDVLAKHDFSSYVPFLSPKMEYTLEKF